jgi:hypothetical protein
VTPVTASNGQDLKVELAGGDVVVTWLCGGTRTFTPDDLTKAIAHLEQLSKHGVWMQAHDSRGTVYAARVVKGRLYAGDDVNAAGEEYVSWRVFKTAVGVKPDKPPPADYAPATHVTPDFTLLPNQPKPARERWWRRVFKRS